MPNRFPFEEALLGGVKGSLQASFLGNWKRRPVPQEPSRTQCLASIEFRVVWIWTSSKIAKLISNGVFHQSEIIIILHLTGIGWFITYLLVDFWGNFEMYQNQKTMIDLFYAGGPIIMSILTLILLAVIVTAFKFQEWNKEMGLLGLSVGILGQVIGLYGVFEGIESFGGEVNQAMIAGGLKYSTISTIFGLLIYIVSLIIRLVNKPRFL
jgi:hypothetical protein